MNYSGLLVFWVCVCVLFCFATLFITQENKFLPLSRQSIKKVKITSISLMNGATFKIMCPTVQ